MNKKRTYEHSYGNNPRLVTSKKLRAEYNNWKKTPDFIKWRELQWRIQRGRCAWCRVKMNDQFTGVHVDHALPIYHEGRNSKDNLVLSHARCNLKKGIRVDGMPQWIKNNMLNHSRRKLRNEQKKAYRKVVTEIIEEDIADSLSWI